jgi:hypothetical protein
MTTDPRTAAEPKERPILFSAEMVRAILDGRKRQTRRVVKPQPVTDGIAWACYWDGPDHDECYGPSSWGLSEPPTESMLRHCPYGKPGDRLWVRESFRVVDGSGTEKGILYTATAKDESDFTYLEDTRPSSPPMREGNWPSIHMPRWASRLMLTIESVRVERLQEISHRDCVAEGWPGADELLDVRDKDSHFAGATKGDWINAIGDGDDACIEWYADLWEQINGAGSWEANPFVWVLGFRVEATA